LYRSSFSCLKFLIPFEASNTTYNMGVYNDYDGDDHYDDERESKVSCTTSAGDFVMKLNRVRTNFYAYCTVVFSGVKNCLL